MGAGHLFGSHDVAASNTERLFLDGQILGDRRHAPPSIALSARPRLVSEGRGRKSIPAEALINLRRRFEVLPARHPDREAMLQNAASLYDVSRTTLYRLLQQRVLPKPVRRAHRGQPCTMAVLELERYCEIIAAMKVRTTNKKGRHISTIVLPGGQSTSNCGQKTDLLGKGGEIPGRARVVIPSLSGIESR
jgi:hypothetical protein